MSDEAYSRYLECLSVDQAYRRQISIMVAAAFVTALLGGIGVYFLDEGYHASVLPMFGLSPAAGNAIGCVFMIGIAFGVQRLASLVFFRDVTFGLKPMLKQLAEERSCAEKSINYVAAELSRWPKFSGVLRGHLDAIAADTEQASVHLSEQFQAIDSTVSELGRFVSRNTARTNALAAESESRIEANRAQIDRIEAYIRQRMEDSGREKERVDVVVREIRSLQTFVELVRTISSQTNFLALNAAIEAARAGEAGRGFAVVADEVRKLSVETDKAVHKISEGIDSASRSIQGQFTDSSCEAIAGSEKTALQEFADQLAALSSGYNQVVRENQAVMAEIHQTSDALAQRFMDAMAGLQFQDVVRQQAEQVNAALEKLDVHASGLAAALQQPEAPIPADMENFDRQLDELFSRYVMDSQRSRHRAAAGASHAETHSTPAALPNVELF
ncbi:MAG: chemotaxis protein [Rhodocyclaceae bacterium]|nr:chemotaxis protein [Rhodocyclaceae bacterium]